MNKHDIIIIGSGPGGYIAAIRASQLGYNVAIVEKEKTLGGICLNWGCIPTKSLLKSAEVYYNIKKSESFGFKIKEVEVSINDIVKRSRNVVKTLCSGIDYLMKKNNIKIYHGLAKLLGNGSISISNDTENIKISAKHIIIATGARSRELPNIKIDNDTIWNARKAMMPDCLPKSLLVIGTGAIGIEFASFYNTLGVKVIMVELKSNILPLEDDEISQLAKDIFIKQGIEIHNNSFIKTLNKHKNIIHVEVEKEGNIINLEVEKIILATGVVANTEDIGLENTQVKIDRAGFIVTNQYCATNEPNVYAIGDVAGPPCLAHKASHEGVICVESIAAKNKVHPLIKENIPSCIYSIPQIASVGLTEKQAREKGYEIKIGKFYANYNGKALAMGETEGLVKVIIEKDTGEILGAHMIGPEVTEMISSYTIGKQLEATDISIKETIFPHPTMSEMLHEAVLCADNESLNS